MLKSRDNVILNILDQLRAYADKVLTTWRALADMSDKQLAMYNRLLCVANASLINTLSAERVGNALTYLGVTLEGCSRENMLAPLALKATAFYPSAMSKAQVDDGPCKVDDGPCEVDDGPCKVDDGPCKMDDGPCKVDDGPCEVDDGLCKVDDRPCKVYVVWCFCRK
ncbi:hypothetical protein HAZT_HAZT003637 [Hyalella azteca]|uniref:Uncharacterized protein n=1 Tax=Hyalella azteca TaxID=294128 RepID=A0A6A0GRM1_HYAAZ|nr:hypothetical protein HAZT_HAZT003637 [Hyalella azteca]